MNQKSATSAPGRPLSPHLSIYKPQLTSVLSITHRITGAGLAFGTVFLVGWLWAAAYDLKCFEGIRAFFNDWPGQILLFGWSFALYFHLCNGIRHLFWDIGKGFEIPTAYRSGYIAVVAAMVLTAVTWIMACTMGAPQ
jgi:succinate dehydrogenase cytochrome b subunit